MHAVFHDGEVLEPREGLGKRGVIEGVAEQVQGHDRVDPRRLDPSPATIGLLPLQDPLPAESQRLAAEPPCPQRRWS